MTIDALVIGSGAGGAVTALRLAERGLAVVVLEEGSRHRRDAYGQAAPEAMRSLYRRRGMTPIMGKTPIGYVEGCCVGGSTEINSGFWHRTPREILLRWKAQYDLGGASPDELAPHFDWVEGLLGVGPYPRPYPKSTQVFARGAEAMGWPYAEVPRTAPDCKSSNLCPSGCPTGAKRGMSTSLLPLAEKAGARVLPGCRVDFLLTEKNRVVGVLARRRRADGRWEQVRIDAEHVFVCCGPSETPALLRRSGIRTNIGNSLRLHPMLKLVAEYDETIDAAQSVMPLIQVKEFWPDISMGGAFFTLGHTAMVLSENWPDNADVMGRHRHLASYYVAVRGTGKGSVRPGPLDPQTTTIKYDLSDSDLKNLSAGLARLSVALLAGGAKHIYPAVAGLPRISRELEAMRWLDESLPGKRVAATTVHAFSSCPMGEKRSRCAVDSFGSVFRYKNLFVNDASILPDSPGVNPQGSIMAFASRNTEKFLSERG